jgi:hypothetical protein
MRPLTRDAHRPLVQALRQIIGLDDTVVGLTAKLDNCPTSPDTPPLLLIESIGSEPWASATFVGQTHWIDVRLEGHADAVSATCRRLGAELGEAEFDVLGHIVADVAVEAAPLVTAESGSTQCNLRLEILTIED